MAYGNFIDPVVGLAPRGAAKHLELQQPANYHTGGMTAIGLGVHNLSTEECILRFKYLCGEGFHQRAFTKNSWIAWFVRMFAASIYKTDPLEESLRRNSGAKLLFGHRGNASRVAVTTTVNSESRLLANYNWGDGERYLNSNILTWRS